MIAGITEKEQKIIERILDKYRKDYAFFYYGSRVKGTYEKTSDLDVLIKGKAEMPLAVLQEIKEEFDNSDLPYIVNFSDYYKLDSSFYERIKPDLIPYNWQEVKLGDVCFYVSQKMDTQSLSIYNYISTENMLPNKSGITNASSLPNISITPSFKKHDILVSNIRPYFKKIWLAQFSGGCSNDVIVFRANKNIGSKFLYYILSDDRFFEYSTQTSKGTKMPRGDKTAILKYAVSLPPLDVQKKIAGVLGALDDKIELNNNINQNLEAQAQALFKSWFVDFEPFGGKMPDDWKIGKLGEIIKITSGKRPLFKCNNKDKFVSIPIVGASDIMGYTNEVLYVDKILFSGRVGTPGVIQRFCDACWPSDNTLVLFSNSYEYVYQCLKRIDFSAMNRGSTQPLITQNDLKNCDIIIPSEVWLNKFEHTAGKLLALNENNEKENTQLTELRDTLLPKLMSGEINVDDVKILADKSSFTGEI